MLDIKFIRESPDKVKENMKRKFQDKNLHLVDDLLKLDKEHLALLKQVEALRMERNGLSEQVNKLKKEKNDASDVLQKVKAIPDRIKAVEDKMLPLQQKILDIQQRIPNILHESVPDGKDASENKEISRHGKQTEKDFEVMNHAELCERLGIADFDASARVAGNGFFYLKGDLALLNQALIQFSIQFMVKRGFTFVEPPLMMKHRVAAGCVDMTFFRDMLYKIDGEDLYLIPTSEHPLIGMFIDQVIDEKSLPIRYCGYSQCFRKEIGSHGIDEKGLFRTHQFNKVEQIVICKPGESYMAYDEILKNSVDLFKELGLPTRILESCSGDLGDLKAKGADLEAWSPKKKEYFEICSVSNLTDAQARRLNIKVYNGKERYYPHTLNNTVVATSRAMVAIIENCQDAEGNITIPKVLRPFMLGKEVIGSAKK